MKLKQEHSLNVFELEPLEPGAVLGHGVDQVVHVDLDGHAVGAAQDQDASVAKLRKARVPQGVGDVDHAGQSKAWDRKMESFIRAFRWPCSDLP